MSIHKQTALLSIVTSPRFGRAVTGTLLGLLLFAILGIAAPSRASAAASDYCSGEFLAVGANWSVCWEIRANEGLAITHAYYTDPGSGFDRRVLADATVAQIFVPYEVGEPRYHDVAYGLGPAMQRLSRQKDCPHGVLLAGSRVCRETEDRGLAIKYCLEGNCTTQRGQQLSLWSSVQAGAYNYIIEWTFKDDGSIEPSILLAGALQFGPTAHIHSVFWRLDFDLDDAENDLVEEFVRIKRANSNGLKGVSAWNKLLGETFRPNELYTFRKWRVRDTRGKNAQGKSWSYEIEPSPGSGSFRTNADEGFLRGELWVTRARSSERFVSTDDVDLLSTYVNGEQIEGRDIVVWYAMHEYHEIRSEDSPYMPSEHMSFEIKPRDFFDDNPLN